VTRPSPVLRSDTLYGGGFKVDDTGLRDDARSAVVHVPLDSVDGLEVSRTDALATSAAGVVAGGAIALIVGVLVLTNLSF
jgi:hypothetical protein